MSEVRGVRISWDIAVSSSTFDCQASFSAPMREMTARRILFMEPASEPSSSFSPSLIGWSRSPPATVAASVFSA